MRWVNAKSVSFYVIKTKQNRGRRENSQHNKLVGALYESRQFSVPPQISLTSTSPLGPVQGTLLQYFCLSRLSLHGFPHWTSQLISYLHGSNCQKVETASPQYSTFNNGWPYSQPRQAVILCCQVLEHICRAHIKHLPWIVSILAELQGVKYQQYMRNVISISLTPPLL